MDSAAADEPVFSDNSSSSRCELRVGGRVAGFVDYRLNNRDKVISLIHTEVDPAFEGEHLGTQLARRTLDDARERGLAVLPYCPFIGSWLRKHPEYADLVPEDQRSSFEL